MSREELEAEFASDDAERILPAPKGAFNVCMRLYGPKSDALTGKWNPPPVKKQ